MADAWTDAGAGAGTDAGALKISLLVKTFFIYAPPLGFRGM